MHTKSLFSLQSMKHRGRQHGGNELPPGSVSHRSPHRIPFSLHLQDRGCDFPLTPATAVTKNCRAARKAADLERQRLLSPETRGKLLHLQRFPRPCPLLCTSIWSDTFLQAPFISFMLLQPFALR